MPVRTALHRHRVRHAGVELQRRVARDVIVPAARVLEHLLHRGEGRKGLYPRVTALAPR